MANTSRTEPEAFSSIGVDIGKEVFHLVGFDSNGKLFFAARSSVWHWSALLRLCHRALLGWRRV
jgi:hypothetical protein